MCLIVIIIFLGTERRDGFEPQREAQESFLKDLSAKFEDWVKEKETIAKNDLSSGDVGYWGQFDVLLVLNDDLHALMLDRAKSIGGDVISELESLKERMQDKIDFLDEYSSLFRIQQITNLGISGGGGKDMEAWHDISESMEDLEDAEGFKPDSETKLAEYERLNTEYERLSEKILKEFLDGLKK